MNRRTVLSISLLAAGAVVGIAREFLFVNLNYQIDHLARASAFSYAHSAFQSWMHGVDHPGLVAIKWMLSAVFVLVNLALSAAMCRIRFANARLARLVAMLYMVLAFLAIALHFLSTGSGWLQAASVQLAHVIQYPIPMLILWAVSLRFGPDADRYI